MSYARHNGKLLRPYDRPDLVKYDIESDTLWLVNGGPICGKRTLFPGCDVFFDQEDRLVTGIRIQEAKKLLWPFVSFYDDPDAVRTEKTTLDCGSVRNIGYYGDTDTLSLTNDKPGAAGIDLFMGCIVFTDMKDTVTEIMLDDSGYLLRPLLGGTAETGLSEAADTAE